MDFVSGPHRLLYNISGDGIKTKQKLDDFRDDSQNVF